MTTALQPIRDVASLPVTEVIPHRPPFLMIDRVLEGQPGVSVLAEYHVDPQNPVFAGHFPAAAVFPGVLVLENMAQAACWVLASDGGGPDNVYLLVRVTQCTFQGMVRPDDVLVTRAVLARKVAQFCHFDCQVEAGGRPVATAGLLVAVQAAT